MKFKPDYESLLDAHFSDLLCNERLSVPGLVVFARCGNDTYHKAFGVSDLATNKPMSCDAMLRMFSMTKVLTSFVALRLYEEGLFDFEDEVGQYIASFDRDWEVVVDSDDGPESLKYSSFLTGEKLDLKFDRKPTSEKMRIKHLMSESAGIEYDLL